MKKALFLSVLINLCLGGFVAVSPLFAQSPVSLNASDLRLVPEYQDESVKGYHLYIRKKPGLESVMLTESAKDPEGKRDSYALRAYEYNSINGDEIRYLNGKKLESVHARYSLIDSTAEKDSVFGEAFHIYIPLKVQYGYPWARRGEIEIKDGIFMNIRAFGKKYADYSGGFFDNSFILDLDGKDSYKESGKNNWGKKGKNGQSDWSDSEYGKKGGKGGKAGRDASAGNAGRGSESYGSSDSDEVSALKARLAEAEKARELAEEKLSRLENGKKESQTSGKKESVYETIEENNAAEKSGSGRDESHGPSAEEEAFAAAEEKEMVVEAAALDEKEIAEEIKPKSAENTSEKTSVPAEALSSGSAENGAEGKSAAGNNAAASDLGDEYYNKAAEDSYNDIAGSSVRSKGPESIVGDIMGLVNDTSIASGSFTIGADTTGEGDIAMAKAEEDQTSSGENALTAESGETSSGEDGSSSSPSAGMSSDASSDGTALSSSETETSSDGSSADSTSNSASAAASESESSDSATGSTAGEARGENQASGEKSESTAEGEKEASKDSSEKSPSASSENEDDEEVNIQNPNENTSIGRHENSIERDYSEEAGKRFLEVSENLTYSKGPETIVGDVIKTFENESSGKKKMDLVFVIDATGSMKDDIEQLRMDLVSQLAAFKASLDSFRVGLVFYRDYGDDFSYYGLPIKYYPFTDNLDEFTGNLNDITILGSEGGDIPEAVYEGLYAGLALYTWDKDAAKKIILIGDAEPHPKPRMTKRYTKQLITKLSKDKGVKIDAIITPDGRIHGEN